MRKLLVVGCGNMGASHARAYHRLSSDFQIVGLVSRGPASRDARQGTRRLPTFADFEQAYAATKPDVVSINTYPDTHAADRPPALRGGSHLFVEKPLAETVAEAQEIADLAQQRRARSSSATSCACTRPGRSSSRWRRRSASRWSCA
jgi:predicted dehydrogenase